MSACCRADVYSGDRLEGLQRLFVRVHELFRQGWTAVEISRHLDCGIFRLSRTRTSMIDIQAIRNAVIEHWSNGRHLVLFMR
jgi:hypothetical protein